MQVKQYDWVFSVVLSVVGLRITSNNSKNKIGLFLWFLRFLKWESANATLFYERSANIKKGWEPLTYVETSYLNTDMCKFESLQECESRIHSTLSNIKTILDFCVACFGVFLLKKVCLKFSFHCFAFLFNIRCMNWKFQI